MVQPARMVRITYYTPQPKSTKNYLVLILSRFLDSAVGAADTGDATRRNFFAKFGLIWTKIWANLIRFALADKGVGRKISRG